MAAPRKTRSAPTLILVHGFRGAPGGLAETAAELHRLVPAARIELPELPPLPAAGNLSAYTADTYADFLASYIRKNHLKKPILVGHSMGSLVVTATASKYPELLDPRLILLAPVSRRAPRPIAALQPLVAILPNRTISYITTKYMFAHRGTDRAATKAAFRHALDLTNAGGAGYTDKRALARAAHFSAAAIVSDFPLAADRQVHLIAGDRDKLFTLAATEQLADKWHAQLTVIPNSGHLLNYEVPKKLAAAIAAAVE